MKKLLTIITLIFVFSSCDKLEYLNENTKDFTVVPGESLFNSANRAFFNQMLTCNVNNNNTLFFAQHLAATTYPEESRYNMIKRTISGNHMNIMYRNVLMNLKESKRVLLLQSIRTDNITQAQRDNQLAEIEIMSVYVMSNVVETFGNMPYSDALDENKPTPKYDDGLIIYKDLIVRLDAAMAKLNVGFAGMGAYDNIYLGNLASTAKWLRFANSLKLRMGLMLADIPSEAAFAKATVEAASPKAFIEGDKFAHTYLNASPNTHPLYTELVASGRADYVAANTLVDAMNTLNDPRRAYFFTSTTTPPLAPVYKGGVYGAANGSGGFSEINPTLVTSNREGLLLDFAEVEFLRAEAVERGYSIDGDAQSHYNAAITASIRYWGGSAVEVTAYLAQPSVNYVTADGPWQNKIGKQAWIAYWFRGFSAWTTWRRLDYPRLIAPTTHVAAVAGVPLRYIYPVSEQTLNGVNYTSAAKTIGGDNAMTPLFWDKTQYNSLP